MASSDPPRRDSAEELDAHIPGEFPEEPPGQQSLAQAVYARRAEYTRPQKIKIKIGSWNVAAYKGPEKDIGGWLVGGKGVAEELAGLRISQRDGPGDAGAGLGAKPAIMESVEDQEARRTKKESTIPKGDPGLVPGDDEVGIYAVGLQEVVDISSTTEALRPYTDPATANRYKAALEEALPPGYVLVAERQLIGMLLLVYAAPQVAPEIRSVSTTSVGTGLMGYMGNKGAVTARFVLGETTRIVFVNSHMAAGADATALERRNWDASQVISRTKFDPIVDMAGVAQPTSEGLGEEDFAFWFGDLNYRLQGMPGDDVRRLLTLHARNEYDLTRKRDERIEHGFSEVSSLSGSTLASDRASHSGSNGSVTDDANEDEEEQLPSDVDPASLQATLASLLPHDELHEQMAKRKAFHDGWREGAIRFMPTYKYDVGTVGVFDSSEKRRCPSWCDRILYRTRRDKLAYEQKIQDEADAKKRDDELRERGIEQASEDEDVLFDYNPDADGEDYDEFADTEEPVHEVTTKEGFEDEIQLELYTSHQRVLSSDHKPLSAVFSLKYDAVVPELKTKVHQDVARELDRAENEGRPTITLLVDRSHSSEPEDIISDSDGEKFEGANFGDVRYGQSKRRTTTIANTGQVPATVGFVDRPVGTGQLEGPMPVWLSAKFDREADKDPAADPKATKITTDSQEQKYTLEPGEATTCTLTLRVEVMDLVRNLNNYTAALEDILVLRVDDGRDHFLPVRARWLQSALASSIDKLIRIPEGGIRRLQGQKPDSTTGHRTRTSHQTSPPGTAGGTASASNPELVKRMSKERLPRPTKSATDPAPQAGPDVSTVKWSAPRELFRLTEAVETLAQRCVAEWDMAHNPPPALPPRPGATPPLPPRPGTMQPGTPQKDGSERKKPPWELHSGWPFWEDSWSPWEADARKAALYATYEALDTDSAFDAAVDPHTPTLARLEATAGALRTFLASLSDGVVSEPLWWQLEADMAVRESQGYKGPATGEDEKSRILEVLAGAPAYNISFVLITSMLARLVAELTAADRATSVPAVVPSGHRRGRSNEGNTQSSSTTPTTTPTRALGFLRRRTLSRVDDGSERAQAAEREVLTRRQLRERAYAVVFGEAMVRLPEVEGLKDKERRVREERRTEVIEAFLREES